MKKLLSLVAVAVLVMTATATPADAAFRLRIEDVGLGVGVVITDEAGGDGSPGTPNLISFSGAVGGFFINFTVGSATPLLVAPGFYDAIHLHDFSMTGGAGTIRLILEKDGFNTAPDGGVGLVSEVGGVFTAPAGSTATFNAWANPGDLVPTLGPDVGPAAAPLAAVPDLPPAGSTLAGPLVFGPGAFGGSASAGFVKSGPYSLFTSAVITFTGPGNISFDHQTGTTPAPAGLLLLAAGAPFLAIGYYRRKKAAVKA
jgi:hypothetical protein